MPLSCSYSKGETKDDIHNLIIGCVVTWRCKILPNTEIDLILFYLSMGMDINAIKISVY